MSSPAFDAAFTLIDAVIVLWFCSANRARLRPLLDRSGLGRRTWHLPLLGFAAFLVFMWAYFLILELLGAEEFRYLDDFEAHGWPLWSALILFALCPAVFEELAFRGVIMSRLEGVMTPKEALLVQAGMFSVLHFLPLIFASHFILGLAFGQLRRMTGSLYPGMLLHLAWNAWVVMAERMA
ncbi:MAG: CPBP family intramembrane metalloprotease [Planctomycetes bacterium]|nr:CPBP family intramembrane metalloprotease [Planctomycetota bacterium]